MTDHRIDAVALAMHDGSGRAAAEDPDPAATQGDGVPARWRYDAAVVLAAADAADAEHGIHRVKLDDQTVHLVALTLGQIQNRGDAFQITHYLKAAHEVLEALTGVRSPQVGGAPGADA